MRSIHTAFGAALAAAMITACGGGGGGGDAASASSASEATVTGYSLSEQTLRYEYIARVPAHSEFPSTIIVRFDPVLPERSTLWFGLDDPSDLLAEFHVLPNGPNATLAFRPNRDLPAGEYSGEARLRICRDEKCTQPLSPDPAKIAIRITVSPNIEVQPLVNLERTGAEAPPTVTVPIAVPAGGRDLTAAPSDDGVISARIVDGSLAVTGKVVQAGVYERTLRITMTGPYQTTTRVRYEVKPPPGGEFNWRVEGDTNFALRAGERVVRTISVRPPTWVPPPVMMDAPRAPWLRVRPLGNDRYELAVDAAGLVGGTTYSDTLTFLTSITDPGVSQRVQLVVDPAFSVTGASTRFTITRATRAADLVMPFTVTTLDGRPAIWSARTNKSWLVPRAASGRAGVDPIVLDIAPRTADWSPYGSKTDPLEPTELVVSIDRPGVPAHTTYLDIVPDLSAMSHALPTRLVARGPAMVRIVGGFRFDVLSSGALSVSGARIVGQSLRGDVIVELELDGLVAGQPVVVALDQGLASKTLSIPVVAPEPLPAVDLPLAIATRRPPQVSSLHAAILWTERGSIMVARRAATSWTLQSHAISGLIDADWGATEDRVFAALPDAILELDPLTFAQRARGRPVDFHPAYRPITLTGADSPLRTLVVALEDLPFLAARGAETWMGTTLVRFQPNGPGRWSWFGSSVGIAPPDGPSFGFLRSADRTAVAGVRAANEAGPAGVMLYAVPTGATYDPPVATPIAVSSFGHRIIDRTWTLYDRNEGLSVSLLDAIPPGLRPRGAALSNDGRVAYVYAARVVSAPGGFREQDAQLVVIDLGTLAPRFVQTIALAQPLACRTVALAAADCETPVHVVLDEHGLNAVALGREGLAVVTLPTATPAARTLTTRSVRMR